MASTTINTDGSLFRYNINGANDWKSRYGGTIQAGRTMDGTIYRCFFPINLSSLTSAMVLGNSTLTIYRSDSYGGGGRVKIGLCGFSPASSSDYKAFSESNFEKTVSSDITLSTGSNSITISADKLNPYKGSTVYVWICGYNNSSYNYTEIAASSNLPTLSVSYEYGKSTMTVSGDTIGSAMTFTISRQSSSFTHTITYATTNHSGTIVTKTSATTVSWTPPMDICTDTPEDIWENCTFTLTTYSGNTSLGSNTYSVWLKVPDSAVPTIANDAVTLTAVSDNATVNNWGVFLAKYSKIRVTWNTAKVSGAYGSTISTYKARINGTDYTGTTATSAVINSAGTYTIQLSVTDSRGKSASISKQVTYTAYTAPYIDTYTAYRSDSGGTKTDGGAYLTIKATVKITSVGSNAGSISGGYKLTSAANYTSLSPAVTSTQRTYSLNLAASSAYQVRLIPSDSISTGAELIIGLAPKSDDIVVKKVGGLIRVGVGKTPTYDGLEASPQFSVFYNGVLRAFIRENVNLYDDNERQRINMYPGSGEIVLKDANGYNRVYLNNSSGRSYIKDENNKTRAQIYGTSGELVLYDASEQNRVHFKPTESRIMLRNSSNTITVDIRGDGTASGAPLPVNQGGTGRTDSTLPYRSITSAPTESGCGFFFRVTQAFTIYEENTSNTLTIPNFAHGFFSSSSDAVMVCVDSSRYLYVCYRNNGTWRGRKF